MLIDCKPNRDLMVVDGDGLQMIEVTLTVVVIDEPGNRKREGEDHYASDERARRRCCNPCKRAPDHVTVLTITEDNEPTATSATQVHVNR